ncbi:MAG: spermidine synthase, partial [Symploca sp. SIO1C4]|nr:spermidine synthase [Symploca sp. SIO1C4]
ETIGGLKLLDGIYLLGLLQTPAYVRRAIASETQVYTIQEPPQFFGQGTLGK